MGRPRKSPAVVSLARSAVAKAAWGSLTEAQRRERVERAAAARKAKREENERCLTNCTRD